MKAVTIISTWAKAKARDFRKLDAWKQARPDFTGRCEG